MAVNLAALRAALICMGTTAEVANKITTMQGIDTIEELHILTDNEVETLCRAIHRPGGLMPNPAILQAGLPLHWQLAYLHRSPIQVM